MVDALIEEMYWSDWNRPPDYRRATVVDAEINEGRLATSWASTGQLGYDPLVVAGSHVLFEIREWSGDQVVEVNCFENQSSV